ncbi:M35 family metallo-endopeptidase [Telluria mixta]|uniref:M35 family metallo-endopeptidase n=1 Tax=Telluria mixta TaxID=34071 RepID=A0ABT2C0S4_9BURK|nr:M35 family metallo-endopeptidase [Telluria mixta]MCS0630987.1 M35 family metallo-endopeptidase [Telluria mixta]WEM98985.1 M35 family metallo-endopeptidase [Telluria mixta]
MNGNTYRSGALTFTLLLGGAVQAAPTGGLVVELTPAQQSLTGSQDVVVTVTIRNTARTWQYLPKWQTPFAGVEAPLFDVTRDGLPVSYLGIQVKRAPPGSADVIALAPGAARSSRVELSALYRMDITGAYTIRYRTGRLQGAAPPPSASIWIDGRLPRGMPESSYDPVTQAVPAGTLPAGRALTFNQCSNAQQDSIAASVQAAQSMVQDGDAYLRAGALAERYTSWFGPLDEARTATVSRHFEAIRDAFATRPITVDCACTKPWYAYVYPNQPYTIHVCKAFWTAPTTGTDSRGGTLVHEMSHFTVVAGTDDWPYGQTAAGALAGSDPARAVDNADSHEYFGENSPNRNLRRR